MSVTFGSGTGTLAGLINNSSVVDSRIMASGMSHTDLIEAQTNLGGGKPAQEGRVFS